MKSPKTATLDKKCETQTTCYLPEMYIKCNHRWVQGKKGRKRYICAHNKHKQTRVTLLILDKTDVKTRDTEKCFMVEGSIHWEETIINVHIL